MKFETKYLVLLTLSFQLLFLSCENNESHNELNGHWHLFGFPNTPNDFYYKLNIQNDSVAYLDGINNLNNHSYSEAKPKKNIDVKGGKMLLWIDGMYQEFNYQLNKDNLILNDRNSKLKLYGSRQELKNCNKIKDYFSSHLVSVNLSSVESRNELIKIFNYQYALQINFGIGKKSKKEEIEFNNRIVIEHNIELELEKFLSTIPEERIDSLKFILSIDHNFKNERVKEFIKLFDLSKMTEVLERKINNDNEIVLVNFQIE